METENECVEAPVHAGVVRSRRYCDNPRCEYYHKQRGGGSFFFRAGTPPNETAIYSTRWGIKGQMNLCTLCAEIVTKATGLDPIPESLTFEP